MNGKRSHMARRTTYLVLIALYWALFAGFYLPFTQVQPASFGPGEELVPKGEGAVRALGELIACPHWIGTWIGTLLVYRLMVAPQRQSRRLHGLCQRIVAEF